MSSTRITLARTDIHIYTLSAGAIDERAAVVVPANDAEGKPDQQEQHQQDAEEQQPQGQRQQSSLASLVSSRSACRICHTDSWAKEPLISPCRYIHIRIRVYICMYRTARALVRERGATYTRGFIVVDDRSEAISRIWGWDLFGFRCVCFVLFRLARARAQAR